MTSVSTQNEQPSESSVEKCDFTEDIQHYTGMLSGALGDHLRALDDHCQCSPGAPLSAHGLLQVGGGARSLQAALSFTLCSYSMLFTLHTGIQTKEGAYVKNRVLLCKVILSSSTHSRTSDWEFSKSYNPKSTSPFILAFSSF